MGARANFCAFLRENGRYVPGSARVGHNVFTNFGREWLARLASWSVVGISTDDVLNTDHRVRWLGVGTGSQFEQAGVTRLVSALSITTGPVSYLREVIGPPPTFASTPPLPFSPRFDVTFANGGPDFGHHGGSVDVSEAGLFVDFDSGGGPTLDTTNPNLPPVAYKAFPVITKLIGQDLIFRWELRF